MLNNSDILHFKMQILVHFLNLKRHIDVFFHVIFFLMTEQSRSVVSRISDFPLNLNDQLLFCNILNPAVELVVV